MTEKKAARQTLTGIIRSRMAQYQARQLAGELQKTFAAELNEEGHAINYKDFRTLYSRAKKQVERANGIRREEPEKESKPAEKSIIVRSASEEIQEDGVNNTPSHNPVDLDEIANSTVDLQALARIAKRNRK